MPEGRSPGKKKQGEENARLKMGKAAVKKSTPSKRDVSEVCSAPIEPRPEAGSGSSRQTIL